MKRYLLFAGSLYYPSGGWDDFIASFDTVDECVARAKTDPYSMDWWHILDTTTWQIAKAS